MTSWLRSNWDKWTINILVADFYLVYLNPKFGLCNLKDKEFGGEVENTPLRFE